MAKLHSQASPPKKESRKISSPKVKSDQEITQDQLVNIFNNIGDAIFVFDPNTEKILEANETAASIYGYSRNELLRMSLRDVSVNPQRGEFFIKEMMNGKQTKHFETSHRVRNGQEITMLCKASLISFNGKTAILTVNRDITFDKNHISLVIEKQAILDLIIDTSQVGLFIIDVKNNTYYFSPSYKKQLGFVDDEFPNSNQSLEAILHPEDKPAALNAINQLILGELDRVSLLHRLIDKYGIYRWILCNATSLKDDTGTTMKVIGVHTDITEIKLKETALRDSEAKFSKIFRSSPAAISVIDIESKKFLDVNDSFEKLYDLKRHQVIGQTPEELQLKGFEHVLPNSYENKYESSPPLNFELVMNTPSGNLRSIMYSVETLQLMDKQCIITTAIDLTEQKIAEKEKQLLSEQLYQAQKLEAVGTLASGIAHDFNNILGIIKMACGLLKHKNTLPENLKYLNTIEESTDRGASISRQLLAHSKRQGVRSEIVSVSQVIQQVVLMLNHSLPKSIETSTNFTTSNDLIMGDSTQLYQILLNLGINARDAMPTGGELRYEVSYKSVKNMETTFNKKYESPYLCIKVQDTGEGMTEEVKHKIFEPFFTTKSEGTGTGLGLSIVKTAVKDLNGFINLESTLKVGTTFWVYLPVLQSQEKLDRTNKPPQVLKSRKTILFVEDEVAMRELVSEILEEHQFRVLVASDGEEGIQLFKKMKDEIDFVLTDIGLPTISGTEMMSEILSQKPSVKFSVLTGFLADDDRQKLNKMGVVKFLRKPVEIDDLITMLYQTLSI